MAETMRERLAQELAHEWHGRPELLGYDVWTDSLGEQDKARFRNLADAVLAAMREPSEAMAREGAWATYGQAGPEKAAQIIFTTMINAARNEEASG